MKTTDQFPKIAGALGPQGVWDALHEQIPTLEPMRNGNVEVVGLCPYHPDSNPSWHWNLEKGIAYCFVCGKDSPAATQFVRFIADATNTRWIDVMNGYCKRLGLPLYKDYTLTLATYASAKQLPEDFLREEFCLSDSRDGLVMPYLSEDGEILANRIRRTVSKRPRWQAKGTPARKLIYGLHRLIRSEARNTLYIGEGESDVQTLHFHGFPVLGLPGAGMAQDAMARLVSDIEPETTCLLPDPDRSGRSMVKELERAFTKVGYKNKIVVGRIPAKDVSALHLESPDQFKNSMSAVIHRARPIQDYLGKIDLEETHMYTHVCRLLKKMMGIKGIKGNDRSLLLAIALSVSDNLRQRIPFTRGAYAKQLGVERHTLYNRWKGLLDLGLIEEFGSSYRLGSILTETARKGRVEKLPP